MPPYPDSCGLNAPGGGDRRAWLKTAGRAGVLAAAGLGGQAPAATVSTTLPWEPGAGDDAAASLQAAIDRLRTSGGTLQIPAGTFPLRHTIRIPSRVRLQGVNTLSSRFDCTGLPPGLPAFTFVATDTAVCEFAHLADLTLLGSRLQRGAALHVAAGAGYRNGHHERLRVEAFYYGYLIEGEMYAVRIDDVEANYLVYAFNKRGTGYMTSLEVSWLKCYRCFHGIHINNTSYARLSYYYDHCGLAAAWPEAPANEVPVSFQAGSGCVNLDLLTGQEYAPAVVLRAGPASTVSLGCALVTEPRTLWVRNAGRSANLPLAEQGLLCARQAAVELRNLRLVLPQRAGYPTAAQTDTPLLAGTGQDARFTITNCLIDTDSYFLSNLETRADPGGARRIAVNAGSRVACVSRITGAKREYST